VAIAVIDEKNTSLEHTRYGCFEMDLSFKCHPDQLFV
jgi:hypothetical protein